jgi:hypothetical protein
METAARLGRKVGDATTEYDPQNPGSLVATIGEKY